MLLGKNIKYYMISVLILVSFSLFGQSQDIKPDQFNNRNQDLWNFLTRSKDTVRVDSLIHQANKLFYSAGNLDSIYFILHEAISLSKAIGYSKGLSKSSANLGFYYYVNRHQDSARFHLCVAIDEANKMQDEHQLALFYLWFGWTFSISPVDLDSSMQIFRLSYQHAVEAKDTFMMQAIASQLTQTYLSKSRAMDATRLCLEMKKIAQISHDTTYLILNSCMLSNIFGSMNLFEKQKEVIYEALKLSDNNRDTQLLLQVYGIAAEFYLFRHQYDSILYYSAKTDALSRKLITYYTEIQIPNWINLIHALLNTQQTDSAKFYYYKVINIVDRIQYPSFYYAELASLELKMGYSHKAEEHFKKAEIDSRNEILSVKMETYRLLYENYDKWGHVDKAFQFLKDYMLYKDSLQKSQVAFNIEYLIMEFETEKKEKQIEALSTEGELQNVIATKQKQKKNMAYGSIALLFFAGSFGFYRFRQYKNLKGKQALSNERLRISRDLHDEVGATLSGISMYSHLAKEQIKTDDRLAVTNSLTIMQETSGEMVTKLNDIVWLLNPDQSHLSKLVEKLEDYASQMAGPKGLKVMVDFPDQLSEIDLTMEVRRNIYLICKEAVNNAVKYSQASLIRMDINKSDHQLIFNIIDNGIGFDPDIVKRGNGLNNMQHRADEIGGEIIFGINETGGTTIVLKYKIT